MSEISRCARCGREMRMGAIRLTVNGRRGVQHYLDHLGSGPKCGAADEFQAAMFKPYPPRDEDKPRFKMIERWNVEQAEFSAERVA